MIPELTALRFQRIRRERNRSDEENIDLLRNLCAGFDFCVRRELRAPKFRGNLEAEPR